MFAVGKFPIDIMKPICCRKSSVISRMKNDQTIIRKNRMEQLN